MARGKKHTAEQVVTLLRQVEVSVANGKTLPQACKEAGIKVNEAGAIYFPKDEYDDIRSKFRILQAGGRQGDRCRGPRHPDSASH